MSRFRLFCHIRLLHNFHNGSFVNLSFRLICQYRFRLICRAPRWSSVSDEAWLLVFNSLNELCSVKKKDHFRNIWPQDMTDNGQTLYKTYEKVIAWPPPMLSLAEAKRSLRKTKRMSRFVAHSVDTRGTCSERLMKFVRHRQVLRVWVLAHSLLLRCCLCLSDKIG